MSSAISPSRILMARVGAAHGVRGEVRVKPFGDDPLSFCDYDTLQTSDGRMLTVEKARVQKAMVITKFAGIDDRTAAETLNGLDLLIARDALPDLDDADEFYHADLLGLPVEDPDGKPVGRIVAVPDFGAGTLLEIAPPHGATFYVPFSRTAVPTIDLESGRVVVAPPNDYLDGEEDDDVEA